MKNCVDLGFAEEQDSKWLLTNRFFPSKIGGKVAWLELENIPEADDLKCDYCSEPCTFLCQIYAGSEDVPHAFHRSIFVFICRNSQCCINNQSGNIKILRSQLPLKNKFYSDKPPDELIEIEDVKPLCKICNICGCKAPMVCGKCKKVNYCGQLHQKMDWKFHKKHCGLPDASNITNDIPNVYFLEYEIVIEGEGEIEVKKNQESEKDAESRRLREYENMVKEGKIANNDDITEKDLQEFAETNEDKVFGRFKKTIEKYPTQVIRYNRHGEPLWISGSGILNNSSIPACLNCNGKRTFEFQIMPQMLNELKNYDLDWGIIAVYTCKNDCNTLGKYIPEFCHKQDITKCSDSNDIDVDMDKAKISNNEKMVVTKKPAAENSKTPLSKNLKDNKESSQKKSFKECDNWD